MRTSLSTIGQFRSDQIRLAMREQQQNWRYSDGISSEEHDLVQNQQRSREKSTDSALCSGLDRGAWCV
jgi:hypothetical protein